MKFLLDMGVSPQSAHFLRSLGYEATHLHERGLNQLSDEEIFTQARVEGSVVLTHDLDFADLLAASGATLPSVVIFRLRSMRPENVNRYLNVILDRYAKLLREGAILSVTEGRIRCRTLPLPTVS